MNKQSQNLQLVGIVSAGGQPPLVDGVDVAQLLRDIGEASAIESAAELFRLCLGAQRVLAAIVGDQVAAMLPYQVDPDADVRTSFIEWHQDEFGYCYVDEKSFTDGELQSAAWSAWVEAHARIAAKRVHGENG